MKTNTWTANDTIEVSEDGTPMVQSYIDGGNYGVMGSVGHNNWCVVHAFDGVEVSENSPRFSNRDEQTARDLAEMLNDAE